MPQELVTTSVEAAIKQAIADAPIPGAVSSDADVSTYQKLHAAKLDAIQQRASKLPPVTNEETLEQNQKALTALVKVRTGLNAYRKDILQPFTDLKKMVDGYFGTDANSGLQEKVAAIEEPIRERINAYKNEQERKRQEAQRIIDKRNEDRAQHVLDRGMSFDGRGYKLGALVLWPADLRLMDEKAWTAWCNDYLEPAVAAVKAKAEQEAREREEDERRRKDEAERLEREKEALRKEKQAMREEHLLAIGVKKHEAGWYYIAMPYGDAGQHLFQTVSDLAGLSDEEWAYVKDAAKRQAQKRAELEANPPGLTEEEAIEQAVSTAMAASSGIEKHPDEKLVRETEAVLSLIASEREMMLSMANRLEAEMKCANRCEAESPAIEAEKTWVLVVDHLKKCIETLRITAEKRI